MKLFFVLALTVLSTAAVAQGRPSTTAMTCQAANSLVVSQRAIVLSTGGDTFDRYVSDQGACPRGMITRPGFVRTADNPQCMVGYLCVDASVEDNK